MRAGLEQEIEPDDEIQDCHQQLPNNAPNAFGLEGMDELEPATEDDQPGDDYDAPQEVANGSAIAKNPKAMSRIAQTFDFPEPSVESAVGAMASALLLPFFLLALVSPYLLHEPQSFGSSLPLGLFLFELTPFCFSMSGFRVCLPVGHPIPKTSSLSAPWRGR
jgi:hypothetical protein